MIVDCDDLSSRTWDSFYESFPYPLVNPGLGGRGWPRVTFNSNVPLSSSRIHMPERAPVITLLVLIINRFQSSSSSLSPCATPLSPPPPLSLPPSSAAPPLPHIASFANNPDDPFYVFLAPPQDETPEQRVEREQKETDARKTTEEIDAMLRAEKVAMKKRKKLVKVLLLGQSESGTSFVYSCYRFSIRRLTLMPWAGKSTTLKSALEFPFFALVVNLTTILQTSNSHMRGKRGRKNARPGVPSFSSTSAAPPTSSSTSSPKRWPLLARSPRPCLGVSSPTRSSPSSQSRRAWMRWVSTRPRPRRKSKRMSFSISTAQEERAGLSPRRRQTLQTPQRRHPARRPPPPSQNCSSATSTGC